MYENDAGYEGMTVLRAHVRVEANTNMHEALKSFKYSHDASMIQLTLAVILDIFLLREACVWGIELAWKAMMEEGQKTMLRTDNASIIKQGNYLK